MGYFLMLTGFIETWSGKKVSLPGCDPESICIDDIAHALSRAPRFAGHTAFNYSVGRHSLNAAALVESWGAPKIEVLQALMHDATEAYLCDIPTPFKRLLTNYKELEDDLWKAITTKFSIPFEMAPSVKKADEVLLYAERNILKPNHSVWAKELPDSVVEEGVELVLGSGQLYDNSRDTKKSFIDRFQTLYSEQ